MLCNVLTRLNSRIPFQVCFLSVGVHKNDSCASLEEKKWHSSHLVTHTCCLSDDLSLRYEARGSVTVPLSLDPPLVSLLLDQSVLSSVTQDARFFSEHECNQKRR